MKKLNRKDYERLGMLIALHLCGFVQGCLAWAETFGAAQGGGR